MTTFKRTYSVAFGEMDQEFKGTTIASGKIERKPKHPSVVEIERDFKNPKFQSFAFPPSLMKYVVNQLVTNHKLYKTWKKLIQTCKFFFVNNPLYPVKSLQCVYNSWIGDEKQVFKSRENAGNLWLVGDLSMYRTPDNQFQLSQLIPKISKCSLAMLQIKYQTLKLEELAQLNSTGIEMFGCKFLDGEGKVVQLDKVIEKIPFVKILIIDCRGIHSTIMGHGTNERIVKALENVWDLKMIHLKNLPLKFQIWPFMYSKIDRDKCRITTDFDYSTHL